MSKLNEIIVSQLPIQSEVKPCTAYLLDNGDGTHDRYVSDEDGNLSKQAGVNLSNYYTKSETFSQTEVTNLLNNKQNNLGYTPENIANKSDSYTASSSTTYASTKALVDGLITKLDKGTYTGTASDLKDEIDSKANISHTHDISSITNLQNSLDTINNDINNLEGINYVWSPTNRVLTLFDGEGTQLSQVSLVSLDNEGTDIRYNASTLSLELYNADNELLDSIPVSSFIGSVGTQLQLNSNQLQLKDSQGNVLSTVNFEVSNINGLQTVLNNKLNTPTMTNNYYGLWDDTNKKFINGQLNQDTNGNIGIGATPTDSKVGLSPLVNQTALKVLNYSLTGSNIQPALDINGTWNTSGNPTLIKANVTDTTSNTNSLLMDLQVNGYSHFSVRKGGVVTFNGPLYVNSISNTRLSLMSFGANGDESVLSNPANNSGASGQKVFIDAAIGIKPTSGNSTLISFLSRPTINQTGGANGITRGLYINPTLTSAFDWRSIEWSNNTGYGLYGAGTANNFLAGNLGIGKLLPVEKLEVNGNIKADNLKAKSTQFQLQSSINPTPNTLVPKTDGSGLLWYDNNSVLRNIGENFFSADLSNTTARNHTMNAGITVNTLGNPYSLTGLPNKEADPSFNKAIRINSSGQLGLGDTQQFNITVPDVITSNNNLSIAPLTVNHIYPNPVPNITTYVQDLQNIMATIGNLNFIKMSNWVVNTNNPTNSSQLIAGDGLVSFNLEYSQSASENFPVASVASQANLFPANKNFVIFFNVSATVFSSRWGIVLAGMSQSDDNTSIIVPTLAYANSNSSNFSGWSSGFQENILSNGQNGSVFIVKSGQVIFVVICNNSTGTKVVASFDANVNGGDYRFVATMIHKDVGSSQPLPLTEIKYWIEP